MDMQTSFNFGLFTGLFGGLILSFAVFGGWVFVRLSRMMEKRERNYDAEYNRIVNTPHHSGDVKDCSICLQEAPGRSSEASLCGVECDDSRASKGGSEGL